MLCTRFYMTGFVFIFFCSVLVFFHFNIKLTEVDVMHEAGHVYSIWSTWYQFPFGYYTSVHFEINTSCPYFIIWEILLPIAH